MPIFISDKTRCPLCREIIERDHARIGFPSFLKSSHGLSVLSDAVAHKSCFEKWKYRNVFLVLFEKFEKILNERPQEMNWRDGENWIRVRGGEFDREAESLDPTKQP